MPQAAPVETWEGLYIILFPSRPLGAGPRSQSATAARWQGYGLHFFWREVMTKAIPTPARFTVRLGHPLLILFWSVWMVLPDVILEVYFHPSHGSAGGISIPCAAMILVHEMLEKSIWPP